MTGDADARPPSAPLEPATGEVNVRNILRSTGGSLDKNALAWLVGMALIVHAMKGSRTPWIIALLIIVGKIAMMLIEKGVLTR